MLKNILFYLASSLLLTSLVYAQYEIEIEEEYNEEEYYYDYDDDATVEESYEVDYVSEEYYEDDYISPDCEDLITYGNENDKSFIHTIYKGKERKVYFEDAIIVHSNSEISGIIMPLITKDKNGFESFFDFYINVKSQSFDGSYSFKFEYSSLGTATFDCINIFPNELFKNISGTSYLNVLEWDLNTEAKSKARVEVLVESEENSLKIYIESENFLDIAASKAEVENHDDYNSMRKYANLFYDQENKLIYINEISSLLLTNMKAIPSTVNLDNNYEDIRLTMFDGKSAKLEFFTANKIEKNKNRIFKYSNNDEYEYKDIKLVQSIFTNNIQKIQIPKAIELPHYFNDYDSPTMISSLELEEIPSNIEYDLRTLKEINQLICLNFLDGNCISEILSFKDGSAELLLSIVEDKRENKADDFVLDFFFFMNDMQLEYEKLVIQGEPDDSFINKTIEKINSIFKKHGVESQELNKRNIQEFMNRLPENKNLIKHYGKDDLQRAFQKLEKNASNIMYEKVIKTKAGKFIHQFSDLYDELVRTTDKDSMQSIINNINNLYAEYKIDKKIDKIPDSDEEFMELNQLYFSDPSVEEKFEKEEYSYALKVISSHRSEQYYKKAFSRDELYPSQTLIMDKNKSLPIKRNFVERDTEFEIEYFDDKIVIKAENKEQGKDKLELKTASKAIDLFSFHTAIAHSKINRNFNREYLLFTLKTSTSISYSYSTEGSFFDDETEEIQQAESQTTFHAEPIFLIANVMFQEEEEQSYKLKVSLKGDYRETPYIENVQSYFNAFGEAAFIIEVEKKAPHKILSIN